MGRVALAMAQLSYQRHRFPPSIIQQAVWLYLRFTLSYRDVEDLLSERGQGISYETGRRGRKPPAAPRQARASSANRSLTPEQFVADSPLEERDSNRRSPPRERVGLSGRNGDAAVSGILAVALGT